MTQIFGLSACWFFLDICRLFRSFSHANGANGKQKQGALLLKHAMSGVDSWKKNLFVYKYQFFKLSTNRTITWHRLSFEVFVIKMRSGAIRKLLVSYWKLFSWFVSIKQTILWMRGDMKSGTTKEFTKNNNNKHEKQNESRSISIVQLCLCVYEIYRNGRNVFRSWNEIEFYPVFFCWW